MNPNSPVPRKERIWITTPILHLKVASLPIPHLEGELDLLPTRPLQPSPLCISLGFLIMMMRINLAPRSQEPLKRFVPCLCFEFGAAGVFFVMLVGLSSLASLLPLTRAPWIEAGLGSSLTVWNPAEAAVWRARGRAWLTPAHESQHLGCSPYTRMRSHPIHLGLLRGPTAALGQEGRLISPTHPCLGFEESHFKTCIIPRGTPLSSSVNT